MKNQKYIKINGRTRLSAFGDAFYTTTYLQKQYKNNWMKGGSIIKTNDGYEFDIISSDPEENDGCVEIMINGDGSRTCLMGIILEGDESEMSLQRFGYSQTCSTNKKMERGKGTKAMLNALIEYVKTHHPRVKRITLSDCSEFECPYGNETKKFGLYSFYMLKYKKPYYMHNFKFLFTKPEQKQRYKKNLSLIKQKLIINDDILHNYTKYMSDDYKADQDELMKFNKRVVNNDLKNIVKMKGLNCLFLFELINYYFNHIHESPQNERFEVQKANFHINIRK